MAQAHIEITGVTSACEGVGRWPDGVACFVPGALPSERVLAEEVSRKDRFLRARLVAVEQASPYRVRPDCPHADRCGGCALRHAEYAYTLALKREVVESALSRVGGFFTIDVRAPIGMDTPLRTRNKAEYAIDGNRIGLMRQNDRAIECIEDCFLQKEESIQILGVTRDWLALHPRTQLRYLVTRVARDGRSLAILSGTSIPDGLDNLAAKLFFEVQGLAGVLACALNPRATHALDGRITPLRGETALTDSILGISLRVSARSFLQVNHEGADKLYTEILRAAGPLTGTRAFDAYCGTGSIALVLARAGATVTGVEIVPDAVADAAMNARINGLSDRATFILDDAPRALTGLLKAGKRPELLCVDPPRKGVDESLIRAVRAARVPRLVYVSCDPATLARDMKRLCADGLYQPRYVQGVDMFPYTAHIENVALLTTAPS